MIKFPSIGQFRSAVVEVRLRSAYIGRDENDEPIYDNTRPLPVLDYVGTVKLHGTNASVVQTSDGELITQSRNRRLSLANDNARFSHFMLEEVGEEFWSNYFQVIRDTISEAEGTVTIYGEWCGQGIQKGVAISSLEKMFVVFAIRLNEEEETVWLTPDEIRSVSQSEGMVKCIFDFPCYEISIDFSSPARSQNPLRDITTAVEEECPVGKAMGSSGTGEGVVWRCVTPGYLESKFWFKVKGEKHSVSKVKTLAPVDVEKLNSIDEFVEAVSTEARLNQGVEYLREMNKDISRKSTGDFLRWFIGDVTKEESDVLEASGLTSKEVNKYLSAKARVWFFNKVDSETFG